MSLLPPSLVFLVGAQRSGTTWVQRLLADHPAVVGGQESHLFSGYLAPLCARWQVEREQRDQGGRTIGLACYLTEAEFREELRGLASRVLGRLASARPEARVLVEKTPDHGLHLPLIHELFPEATVVHVLRDGRDVAASLCAARRRRWGSSWASANVEEAAIRWVNWVQTIRTHLPLFQRTCTIRYEELIEEGPAALSRLYDFLGIPLPAGEVEAIHDRWRFACVERNGNNSPDNLVRVGDCATPGGGEPEGFYRRGEVGGWREDFSPHEQERVETIAGELLRELGYPGSLGEMERYPVDRFVSTAPVEGVLFTHPGRVGIIDRTNAQMLYRERLYLYATVLALAPERCLEVGVSQGGSTRILHAALADLKRGRLVSVDPQPNLSFHPDELADHVTFLTGPSPRVLPAARDLAGGAFDFILVDGDHSTGGVLDDLEGVVEVSRPGAVILVHDAYCPSVAAGIDAVLAGGLPYVDAGLVSTTCHPGRIGPVEAVYGGFRMLVRTAGQWQPSRFDRLARRLTRAVGRGLARLRVLS